MNTPNQRWEPKDVNVPILFFIAVVLVVTTVLLALASGGFFRALSLHEDATDPQPPAIAGMRETPAEPLLQAHPGADLLKYQASQQRELNEYGWIDHAHGVVRLPVARAMELLVQRGLPATPPAGTDLQFRQQQGGGVPPPVGAPAMPALLPTPRTMTSTPTLPPSGGPSP